MGSFQLDAIIAECSNSLSIFVQKITAYFQNIMASEFVKWVTDIRIIIAVIGIIIELITIISINKLKAKNKSLNNGINDINIENEQLRKEATTHFISGREILDYSINDAVEKLAREHKHE